MRQEMGFFDQEENSATELTAFLAEKVDKVKTITTEQFDLVCQLIGSMGAFLFVVAVFSNWRLLLAWLGFIALMSATAPLQVRPYRPQTSLLFRLSPLTLNPLDPPADLRRRPLSRAKTRPKRPRRRAPRMTPRWLPPKTRPTASSGTLSSASAPSPHSTWSISSTRASARRVVNWHGSTQCPPSMPYPVYTQSSCFSWHSRSSQRSPCIEC